jgi:hypothetical protein
MRCSHRSFAAICATLAIAVATLGAQGARSLGSVELTQGWATFGQVLPQGAARSGLRVGTFATQTDVKNRWPDGSIRFAIVSVNAARAGSYPLTEANTETGSFVPSLPTASVAFTIGAVRYIAALPPVPSSDVWLDGTQVREWRVVVAPVNANGLPHASLSVIFDVRVYRDNTARVDVTVENVVDHQVAGTVTYDTTITVAGRDVFTQARVEHFYLTRWRKVFELAQTPFAIASPDLAPFHRAGALPPYLTLVAPRPTRPAGPTYDILRGGALNIDMPAHGGRPELAPYPDWTARYLVHRDPADRAFVLANGDLSGSWPIHLREHPQSEQRGLGNERLVSLQQRPRLWFDERAAGDQLDFVKGRPLPLREYGSTTPGPGQSPLIPDTAHQPSIAFVPYLMTGDRYYAEEMAFWANYSMMRTYPMDGVRGGAGVLAYNEVRGYGWALRNLADAAAYYPDQSPIKAYLSQAVMANLQWLDNYAREKNVPSNPFHVLWTGKRPEANFISLWEQSYLAFAIDRANRHGFVGGLEHRDAIARLQLRLFSSAPDYPREQGAPYVVGVGVQQPGTFNFFTTMAQVWQATKGQERAFPGYYGPEARLNLMFAIERGWPGAKEAYDFLWPHIAVHPFIDGLPDLALRAGWAVDFYPVSTATH